MRSTTRSRSSESVPRQQKSGAGFTLFEVVVAITIMSVAITSVLVSFNGMNEAHRLMERRTEASLFARSIVAQVRNQLLTPKSEENEGEFEGTDYRYKVSFTETEWEKLYAVSINIEWGEEKESPEKINVYTLQYYN